jgi:hypothetical protein
VKITDHVRIAQFRVTVIGKESRQIRTSYIFRKPKNTGNIVKYYTVFDI